MPVSVGPASVASMSAWANEFGAFVMAVMALCCVPYLFRLSLSPYWDRVPARVVSSYTHHSMRSTESLSETTTVKMQVVRVAYSYQGRAYEQELGDCGRMFDARPGDMLQILVCPYWPRLTHRDWLAQFRLHKYILGILFWAFLSSAFTWAAVEVWNR